MSRTFQYRLAQSVQLSWIAWPAGLQTKQRTTFPWFSHGRVAFLVNFVYIKTMKKNFVFKYKTTLGLASGKRKQVFCLNSSCTVYALRDVQRHQPLSTQRQRCPPHTCSETLGESMVSTKVLWERNRGNNYFVKESEELFLKKVSSELCLKG